MSAIYWLTLSTTLVVLDSISVFSRVPTFSAFVIEGGRYKPPIASKSGYSSDVFILIIEDEFRLLTDPLDLRLEKSPSEEWSRSIIRH